MYNMVFGMNRHAPHLLMMLGVGSNDVGRVRDAFVSEGQIVVYARNGGANRECMNGTPGPECECTGCAQTYRVVKHPLYVRDADDAYDDTYCTTWFKLPDDLPDEVRQVLVGMDIGKWDPSQRWKDALEAMKTMSA